MSAPERAFELYLWKHTASFTARGRRIAEMCSREPFVAGFAAGRAAADREIEELRAECDELRRRLSRE